MIYAHNDITMTGQMLPQIKHLGAIAGKTMGQKNQRKAALAERWRIAMRIALQFKGLLQARDIFIGCQMGLLCHLRWIPDFQHQRPLDLGNKISGI